MPNLNDFYAFKMTTSGSDSGGGENNSLVGGTGCSTVLIVLAVIGWALWLIGKFLAQYLGNYLQTNRLYIVLFDKIQFLSVTF